MLIEIKLITLLKLLLCGAVTFMFFRVICVALVACDEVIARTRPLFRAMLAALENRYGEMTCGARQAIWPVRKLRQKTARSFVR